MSPFPLTKDEEIKLVRIVQQLDDLGVEINERSKSNKISDRISDIEVRLEKLINFGEHIKQEADPETHGCRKDWRFWKKFSHASSFEAFLRKK